MKINKKILLALDGSEQSCTSVRYVGRVFSKQTEVVLFHVKAEVPEAFRDLAVDPSTGKKEYPLQIWRIHQQDIINEFMEKARKLLIDSGNPEESVSVKVKMLTAGIARDIINESYHDYSALVVGRNGMASFDEIVMGNVTSKIVDITSHIPVAVVGNRPISNKILLAFDGSKGSWKAVDCIGELLDPATCEVMLCHVIRSLDLQQLSIEKLFAPKHERDWIEAGKQKIVPALAEAKKRLLKAGLAAEQVSSEILTYEKSRAAAIAKAARSGGYDTIVLGRRGHTSVEHFMIGRVSRKIINFAYQPALWIVS
jgi:nucleotide-binding universal stress UspA family protein